MGLRGDRPTFGRTPFQGSVYMWQPTTSNSDKRDSTRNIGASIPNVGCTATAYSQGVDNNTTYVYDLYLVNGIGYRGAYVVCDYVQ